MCFAPVSHREPGRSELSLLELEVRTAGRLSFLPWYGSDTCEVQDMPTPPINVQCITIDDGGTLVWDANVIYAGSDFVSTGTQRLMKYLS